MQDLISTAMVPERHRFEHFHSVINSVFCPMHVQPQGPSAQRFRAIVETADLGSVRLARVVTSPCLVRRLSADIARAAEARYLVKFQLRGESVWSQRNRTVHLRPGDFVIASMAEPYSLLLREDYEMPVLSISAQTMRGLTTDPGRFLGVRMAREDADCGLLSSFIEQVVARMSRLNEPMISRVEANILDLLGGVLSARDRETGLSPAQQLSQIKAYIQKHLHDRRLDPVRIASAFGVSTRHLHSLFENEPLSVGRYVRSLRVLACRRMLTERGRGAERSLTDVALECGFYDLSHMTRCFREHFGTTPRDFCALVQ
jgi:AraC-like DNA-binding protein